jgi:hypothetical protein
MAKLSINKNGEDLFTGKAFIFFSTIFFQACKQDHYGVLPGTGNTYVELLTRTCTVRWQDGLERL